MRLLDTIQGEPNKYLSLAVLIQTNSLKCKFQLWKANSVIIYIHYTKINIYRKTTTLTHFRVGKLGFYVNSDLKIYMKKITRLSCEYAFRGQKRDKMRAFDAGNPSVAITAGEHKSRGRNERKHSHPSSISSPRPDSYEQQKNIYPP